MNAATFERLLDEFLMPMLPGATRGAAGTIVARTRQVVSYATAGGGNQLLLRPDAVATVEYTVSRSQKFEPSEFALAKAFINSAREVEGAIGQAYEAEVLRGLPMRVVARAAGGTTSDTLRKVLEQFRGGRPSNMRDAPSSARPASTRVLRATLVLSTFGSIPSLRSSATGWIH